MDTAIPATSKYLLDEYPLIVQPSLAKAVGLHEALILQQIHYWLQRSRHIEEGRPWVYNSYAAWAEQMPFLTSKQVRTAIGNLRKNGYVKTGNWNKRPGDQTLWYCIDYEAVNTIEALAQTGRPDAQTVIPDAPQGRPDAPQGKPLPETTTETTTPDPPPLTSQATSKEGVPKTCGWCAKPRTEAEGVHYLLQQVHDRYRSAFGDCPTLSPGRDGALLKKLLGSGKAEAAILGVYDKYLKLDDEWYIKHGYDIPGFCRDYDGLKLRRKQQTNLQILQELQKEYERDEE